MKTLLKTLSWAMVSGILIGVIAYLETGMLKAAFITALFSALLKTPIYSVHEVAWSGEWKSALQRAKCRIRRNPCTAS